MQNFSAPILRDLVLIGGGHSHVGVLKAFGMQPLPGVRITLICTDAHTPYSGMLPGYVAGHYDFDAVHLDLLRLCVFAGARFIQAEVTGIDRNHRKVQLRGRPALDYDVVSINTGSTPQTDTIPGAAEFAVCVKPIASFNQRWLALLAQVRQGLGPKRIAVVGAGAGGVELLLAMQHRLNEEVRSVNPSAAPIAFELFTSSATVLPTHNMRVQHRFLTLLKRRHVTVHCNARIDQVSAQGVHQSGPEHSAADHWTAADAVFWVTQAGGGAWLQDTGLACDAQGFVRVNAQLQSISDARFFAAGDVASMEGLALEKAGVFAVRMGMPLARNLRNALFGKPLQAYRPQTRWLALISTGDRYAVASRGALDFAGTWVWRWKDWIDRRFMARFTDLGITQMATPDSSAATAPAFADQSEDESEQALSALAMRCGGCGAKVGASVLAPALAALVPLDNPAVLVGLQSPDDAAIVQVPEGYALVHTVDFFRAFVDDPYRFGKIAANHALGDIFAMGARPQTATAIATVPPGLDRQTHATLTQMMTGAVETLNAAGCTLVGGHTGEGQELALGFAINGLVAVTPQGELQGVMRKAGMQAGDVLILTKPLGTGTLFAAHALGLARGRWIEAALSHMEQSNLGAAQTLQAHGARACTDVTGFGLLGHLVEMTRPSGVDAEIHLDALPVLDGALECLGLGQVSSLHNANARMRSALAQPDAVEPRQAERFSLLFDPQTAGGLLASLPASQAEACLQALQAQGYSGSAIIGRVLSLGGENGPIRLVDGHPQNMEQ